MIFIKNHMQIIYLILIIYVIWLVSNFLRKKELEKPENKITSFEKEVIKLKAELSDMGKPSKSDKVELDRFENWYIQLKEKDKHNLIKVAEHAQDLRDFVQIIYKEEIYAAVMNGCSPEGADSYREKHTKQQLKKNEIVKRFTELLGLNFEKIVEDDKARFEKEYKEIFNVKGDN